MVPNVHSFHIPTNRVFELFLQFLTTKLITLVFGWPKVSIFAPSKFRVVPDSPIKFGKYLQSSAGFSPIIDFRCQDVTSLVTCWEQFQGLLAMNLPKIGRIRHYNFFYRPEQFFYFWPFLAHENHCVILGFGYYFIFGICPNIFSHN